ncbi:MAG TPA: hypothetical protein VHA09_08785 [Nitrososphaera sp.]|nr:hypothetical protein [Nitrososphaera sp.]
MAKKNKRRRTRNKLEIYATILVIRLSTDSTTGISYKVVDTLDKLNVMAGDQCSFGLARKIVAGDDKGTG